MDIFLIVIQSILLLAVLYFIWYQKSKDRVQQTLIIGDVLDSITKQNEKLYEVIEKIQIKYFDSLEKHSQKYNVLLDKNNREFLKVFAQVFKKEIPVNEPRPIESDKVENSIETAREPEEVLLTDMPRVPIVEGVKIKFEDEEEVYPMNINPIENFMNDIKEESVNPIEE